MFQIAPLAVHPFQAATGTIHNICDPFNACSVDEIGLKNRNRTVAHSDRVSTLMNRFLLLCRKVRYRYFVRDKDSVVGFLEPFTRSRALPLEIEATSPGLTLLIFKFQWWVTSGEIRGWSKLESASKLRLERVIK